MSLGPETGEGKKPASLRQEMICVMGRGGGRKGERG